MIKTRIGYFFETYIQSLGKIDVILLFVYDHYYVKAKKKKGNNLKIIHAYRLIDLPVDMKKIFLSYHISSSTFIITTARNTTSKSLCIEVFSLFYITARSISII